MTMTAVAQVCKCDGCRRTVAEIKGDQIVIIMRHGNEWHQTTIPIASLTTDTKSSTS